MLIYYPDEKLGYKIKINRKIQLSTIQMLWGLNNEILIKETSLLGYNLFKSEVLKNHYLEWWKPKKKSQIEFLLIAKDNDKVISMKYFGKNQKLKYECNYLKHTSIDGFIIPTNISIVTYNDSGNILESETIKYSEMKLDNKISNSIFDFDFPENTKIETVTF